MQNDLSHHLARAIVDDRLRAARHQRPDVRLAAHHFSMPVVRELGAPVPPGRHTQRDLVVASLMVCDREDRPVHRRWA